MQKYLKLIRFDRPAGTLLLFIPCCFGLMLAGERDIFLYLIFLVGAFLMRSSGCIINDFFDRDFDAKTERTRHRPLASGEISVPQAMIFLFILLLMSAALLFFLPPSIIAFALLCLPLVITYPLAKRFSSLPQLFLALSFNWGALMGYFAVMGEVDLPAIILYFGCVMWTMGYDTHYALQDAKDDVNNAVKSSALYFGNRAEIYCRVFYILFIISLGISFYLSGYIKAIPALLPAGYLLYAYAKPNNALNIATFAGLIIIIGLFFSLCRFCN